MNSNDNGKSFVSKNRVYIGVALIICAIVCGLFVFPKFASMQINTYSVVVASADIKEGSIINKDNLKLSKTTDKVLAQMVAANIDKIIGKVAVHDINHDNFVFTNDYADKHIKDTKYNTIPSGKQLISISITSLAQEVSAQLREGDIVRIFAIASAQDAVKYNVKQGEAYTPYELQYVKVIAIHTADGEEISADGKVKSNKDEVPSPKAITFLVNQAQAQRLVQLEKSNTPYFTLISRDKEDYATSLLKAQDDLIDSNKQ